MKSREKQTIAVLLMLVGAFTSSFIAPISTVDISFSPLALLCFATFLAFFGHLPFISTETVRFAFRSSNTFFKWSFLGGALLTLSYVIFAYAIKQSNNAVLPTFAFELYPLGIIIFSNIILSYQGIKKTQIIWLLIGIIGIAILGYDALIKNDGTAKLEFDFSFALALLSVFCLALGMSMVSKGADVIAVFAEKKRKEFDEDCDQREKIIEPDIKEKELNKFLEVINGSSTISSATARVGGFILLVPLILIFSPTDLSSDVFNNIGMYDILIVFAYGFVILTISNIAYYKAILLSNGNHLINGVWYITPILSVLWLYLLGEGHLTTTIGLGAICIIAANIMINLSVDHRVSYVVIILAIISSGAIIFFGSGTLIDSYYEAVAAPLIFFGLLYGFIVERLVRRTEVEQDLALGLYEQKIITQKDWKGVSSQVDIIMTDRDVTNVRRVYNDLVSKNISGFNYHMLDKLVLSKTQGVSFGEIFVLCLTALFTVFVAIYGRDNTFLGDMFALVITVSVVFTLSTVLDLMQSRRTKFSSHVSAPSKNREQADVVSDIIIHRDLFKHSPMIELITAWFMILALFAVFAWIFYLENL